jgi:hypothetical protein
MFWLVYQTADGLCVILQPASSLTHARLVAGMKGMVDSEFSEGHALDPNLIKKLPTKLIGRRLSQRQAAQLLKALSAPSRKTKNGRRASP